jgi:hypothetical protein
MPWPWPECIVSEYKLELAASSANDFSDAFYKHLHTPWAERLSKAAFFSKYHYERRIIYDAAAWRPELFHARYHCQSSVPMRFFGPWNPLSDKDAASVQIDSYVMNKSLEVPGFNQPMYQFCAQDNYNPSAYKFVIVPLGVNDDKTSGIFLQTVVLLVSTSLGQHFTTFVIIVHCVVVAFIFRTFVTTHCALGICCVIAG